MNAKPYLTEFGGWRVFPSLTSNEIVKKVTKSIASVQDYIIFWVSSFVQQKGTLSSCAHPPFFEVLGQPAIGENKQFSGVSVAWDELRGLALQEMRGSARHASSREDAEYE